MMCASRGNDYSITLVIASLILTFSETAAGVLYFSSVAIFMDSISGIWNLIVLPLHCQF